jgi:hypothetical protein
MATEATSATTTNGRKAAPDVIDDLMKQLEAAVSNDNITDVVLVATRALLLAERWKPRPAAD